MTGLAQTWIVLAALVLSCLGGRLVVIAVLRSASRGADGDHSPTSQRAVVALRGGTWIGYVERIALTGALLAGNPAAIAVIVAVKGLGRYPELKENPDASERFVIGTLVSLTWAAVCGLAAAAYLSQ